MIKTTLNSKYINTISLLIIEDNAEDQLVLERFIKKEYPCKYKISNSVEDALDKLNHEQFNVIITDFELGDGTADDVLNYLKKDNETDSDDDQNFVLNKVFIIVTGAGNEELAVNFMRKGASNYLIKDLEFNYLKMLPLTIERAIKRINVENEIKEKNLILNGILNNIPIIVFKTNEHGNFTEVIGSGLKRFDIKNEQKTQEKLIDNYSKISSQFIGNNIFDIFQDLSRPLIKGIKLVFSNPGRSTNFVGEININNITGFFDNYIFFDQEQKKGGSIGFSIDITEKKKAEAQLNQIYQGVQDVFAQLTNFDPDNQK